MTSSGGVVTDAAAIYFFDPASAAEVVARATSVPESARWNADKQVVEFGVECIASKVETAEGAFRVN